MGSGNKSDFDRIRSGIYAKATYTPNRPGGLSVQVANGIFFSAMQARDFDLLGP